MDGGFTARQILNDLAAIAATGVPQPLDYLVKDVARRHGEVSVTEVVCVVRGVNPALLAEMVGHRKLVKLGLSALAPTVLASGVPLEQTLSALRRRAIPPSPLAWTGYRQSSPPVRRVLVLVLVLLLARRSRLPRRSQGLGARSPSRWIPKS